MTEHELYESVDALLDPQALSALIGWHVGSVREQPLGAQESAWSGSGLSAVETDAGRLILKRVSAAWDYFMRTTGDTRGREALVWTTGLLDQLPAELGHSYLACARDGDGWAILMRDVAGALLPRRTPISPAGHERILSALAAFHAACWDDPRLADPAAGFCDPWHHYHLISPDAALRDSEPDGALQRNTVAGWEAMGTLIDPGVAAAALALTNEPAPLVAAIARYPQTVVHADPRPANVGIDSATGQVLLIDWALTGRGVFGLDMVWYIAGADAGGLAPMDIHASIRCYQQALRERLGARFDDGWWQPVLELSLLGGLIRHGWIAARLALAAHDADERARWLANLRWWADAAKPGLARVTR